MPKLLTFNFKLSTDKGFTLIEALIYIVLFSFIIGAGVASAFYLIQGTDELRREALAEAEANFVLRRIDQLFLNADSANVISGGEGVSADGVTIELDEPNNQVVYNGTGDLMSGKYEVSLLFTEVASPAEGIETELTVNENQFHKIYYLR